MGGTKNCNNNKAKLKKPTTFQQLSMLNFCIFLQKYVLSFDNEATHILDSHLLLEGEPNSAIIAVNIKKSSEEVQRIKALEKDACNFSLGNFF